MKESDIIDALVRHQAYSYRQASQLVAMLNDKFISASTAAISALRELIDELSEAEQQALLAGKYTTDSLRNIRDTLNEWKTATSDLSSVLVASLPAVAAYEAQYAAKAYGEKKKLDSVKLGLNKPITGGMLFDEVWSKVANDVKEKALFKIRQGIQEGVPTADIMRQLRGKRVKKGEYVGGMMQEAQRHIESIVRTTRSHVANTAMESMFGVLGYTHMKLVATLDSRTTLVCAANDSKVWEINDPAMPRPPLHYNCRSILVGTDADGRVLGKRPFKNDDEVGQIDANTSFKQWFASQDAAFQEEWLGTARYKMYKDGKYSIDKFIDPLGKKYTLEELKAIEK